MPSPAVVEAFVATVEGGEHVEAIERFYAPDAWMRENLAEPRRGRDRLVAEERAIMSRFTAILAQRQGEPLISGDRVAIRWRFEFQREGKPSRVLEEIAWQTWSGDRIVEETFFYDPAQMGG